MKENAINQEAIAKNLKKIRKSKKITQKKLGELIGKSERTIQNYESGTIIFNTDMISKLTTALDISWNDLVGTENNSNNIIDLRSSVMNKYSLESFGDIINVLFKIQQTYDITMELDTVKPPTSSEWKSSISVPGKGSAKYDTDFCLFFDDWNNKIKQLYNNEITIDEYQSWQEETIIYYMAKQLTPWYERPDCEKICDTEGNEVFQWKNPKETN